MTSQSSFTSSAVSVERKSAVIAIALLLHSMRSGRIILTIDWIRFDTRNNNCAVVVKGQESNFHKIHFMLNARTRRAHRPTIFSVGKLSHATARSGASSIPIYYFPFSLRNDLNTKVLTASWSAPVVIIIISRMKKSRTSALNLIPHNAQHKIFDAKKRI